MYIPSHFEERRAEVLHRLVAEHSFGTLVTLGSGGLGANHLPFELDPGAGPLGTLRAHVARANPVWRDCAGEVEALAIFQGPGAYVSPSWYPAKQEHGKVVPTYNYIVVHAHGPIRVIDDPVWLKALIERLTDTHEAGRPVPWKVADAPADYIEKMLGAIVGIEIPISRLQGKWKASQNRGAADRRGVAQGLLAAGGEQAAAMAAAVMAMPDG
ncbi:MAG TPA: FMN-binding negative transcriptional regulator [Paucimonas sp.]|nr:FMN-binding negative transcriptional regulator [Paucimonas sp.]